MVLVNDVRFDWMTGLAVVLTFCTRALRSRACRCSCSVGSRWVGVYMLRPFPPCAVHVGCLQDFPRAFLAVVVVGAMHGLLFQCLLHSDRAGCCVRDKSMQHRVVHRNGFSKQYSLKADYPRRHSSTEASGAKQLPTYAHRVTCNMHHGTRSSEPGSGSYTGHREPTVLSHYPNTTETSALEGRFEGGSSICSRCMWNDSQYVHKNRGRTSCTNQCGNVFRRVMRGTHTACIRECVSHATTVRHACNIATLLLHRRLHWQLVELRLRLLAQFWASDGRWVLVILWAKHLCRSD